MALLQQSGPGELEPILGKERGNLCHFPVSERGRKGPHQQAGKLKGENKMKEKRVWGMQRRDRRVRPLLGQPPAQPPAPGGPLQGSSRVLLRKVPLSAGVSPAQVLLGGQRAAATWCSAAPPAARWAASAPFCTGA